MTYPFAIGDTVYLRALEPGDADRCARWINDPETTQYLLAGRYPVSVAKEEDYIDKLYASEDRLTLAICLMENDLHIGVCSLENISAVHRSATAGILIGERSLLGKGYGTAALALLLTHGFSRLNLRRVQLAVFDFNTRAIASYKKLGFVEEGRLRQNRFVDGRYVDELMMGLLLEEWRR